LPNTLTLPSIDESLEDVDMCAAIEGLCGATTCPGEELLGARSNPKGTGFFLSGCGNLSKLVFKKIKARMNADAGLDVAVSAPDLDVDVGCVEQTVHVPRLPEIRPTNPITVLGKTIWPGTPGRAAVPAHDVVIRIPFGCDPLHAPSVFTRPELASLSAYIHPSVDVEIEVEAAGSGDIVLRIPIPKLTVPAPPIKTPMGPLQREYIGWGLGVYLVLEGRLTETSTHFIAKVKDEFIANFAFNPASGWTTIMAQGPFDVTGSVAVASPDTTAFRYGIQPAVGLQIEPNRDNIGTLLPGYQAQVGLWANRYFENIFTADPTTGTLKNDANVGLKGRVYGGLAFVPPGEDPPCSLADLLTCDVKENTTAANELLNGDWPFSCCESDIYEQYGVGQFRFKGKTTGDAADRDPDGYTLNWHRTSTSPAPYVDSAMTTSLGANGEARHPDVGGLLSNLPSNPFGLFTITNCTEFHSDGVIAVVSPGVGLLIPELRRTIPGIPAHSKIIGCASLPADYTLTVSGLAQNCTVQDANPRVVTLRPLLNLTKLGVAVNPIGWSQVRDETDVDVNVYCRPLAGDLRVTATTTGADPDVDGYALSVDGTARGNVGANAATTVSAIRAGHHTLSVNGVAFNCTLSSPNPQGVDIQFEATSDAAAQVSCVSTYTKACDMVKAAMTAGQISPSGIATSLCQKLKSAESARSRGDASGVKEAIDGFAAELSAQRGKHIPVVVADALLATAAYIAANGYFMPSSP
jgi:hypothetical protein